MKLTRQDFSQEMHACGPVDDEATLSISIQDGGGGQYVVLNAHEWSIEIYGEIDELAERLRDMLKQALA